VGNNTTMNMTDKTNCEESSIKHQKESVLKTPVFAFGILRLIYNETCYTMQHYRLRGVPMSNSIHLLQN
jgi:hypothetical protein